MALLVSHCDEPYHHRCPVQIVSDDGPICRRVSPAQDGIEDAPPPSAIELGIATVHMPDTLPDIVRSWPRSCFRAVAPGDMVPRIGLEVPHSTREQTSRHQI